MTSSTLKTYRFVMAALVFAAVVSVMYANTLRSPFIYDDHGDVLLNPHIRLKSFSLDGLREAAFESICPNRPVANISFALNYYLHEYRLPGYHLLNILIHFLNGLAVFLLFQLTLTLAIHGPEGSLSQDHGGRGREVNVTEIAFWAALIWLANPLHTNAVTYIVQRMTSLAALFYLTGLLCFIRGRMIWTGERVSPSRKRRSWLWFGAATVSGLLAMGTKEITATLPVMILLYEWLFFRQGRLGRLRRWWPALVLAVAVPAAAGILYLQFHVQTRSGLFSHYADLDFTPGQRLLSEFRVVVYGLNLLLFPFPHRMSLIYDYPVSRAFLDPITTPLAVLAVPALLCLAVYTIRKHRLIAFAIFWYFGNLAIESSILPLDLWFEHRLYLPSIFPVLAMMYGFSRVGAAPARRWCLALLVAALAFGTVSRNRDWGNSITLWEKIVAHSPGRYQSQNDLGAQYLQQGKLEDALARFNAALRIRPDFASALSNAGIALFGLNRKDEAQAYFEQALVHEPESVSAQFNLGYLLAEKGRLDEAIAHYEAATRMNPGYAKAWAHMGVAWMGNGRLEKAEACFRKVLSLRPADPEATAALEQVMRQRDALREEAARIEEELRRRPDHPGLLFRLGMAHEKSDDRDKALTVYDRITTVVHDARPAAIRAAGILADDGRFDEAIEGLNAMLRRFPEDARLDYNIACLYSRKGEREQAIEWLRRAVGKGYENWEQIRTDPDLELLRTDPAVVEWMGRGLRE